MFHPDTQFVIDHWTALARRPDTRGGIPDRSRLEPYHLGLRLTRALTAWRAGDDAVVRLAGGWIEGFHGEPLKGRSLLSLWREESRPMVAAALAQSVREARPVVTVALAGEGEAGIEVTWLPLRGPSGEADRLLGLYAPEATLTLAADEPRLLTARVSVAAGDPPALTAVATAGRRIA